MSLTKTQVSQLYISLFGRAAEGAGNDYWQADPYSTNTQKAADVMLTTDAAKAYFGPSLNDNKAFVEHIYSNTLGKTYSQDQAGIDYWVTELSQGKSKGEIVAAIITAAQQNVNSGNAQDQFNNKVAVSNYVADNILEFTDLTTFTNFIKDVTYDSATVSTAYSTIDTFTASLATSADTLTTTMTTSLDTIATGEENDDIIGQDTTYNSGDTIDGGGGIDRLSLLLISEETDGVTMKNVEKVTIRNAASSTNIDAIGWTGVESLTFDHCTAKTTVSNITKSVDITITNNNESIQLSYADDTLGVQTNQSLTVSNSNTELDVQSGGADAITLCEINTSGVNILSLTENDITKLTISGDGSLQLLSSNQDSNNLSQISTIDASDYQGNLMVDLSSIDLSISGDYFATVNSGAGDDTITASASDNQLDTGDGDDYVIVASGLDSKDHINCAAGFDTLVLTSSDFEKAGSDTTMISGISGVESIGIKDELDLSTAIDISPYGVNAIVIQSGIKGDQELSGFTSGAIVEVQTDGSETDILTINMPEATNFGSNSDSLNIIFNADLKAGSGMQEAAFDIKGINSISVSTADSNTAGESAAGISPESSDGYKLTLTNDSSLKSISVTGTQAFSYSPGTTSNIQTITATEMYGNMVINIGDEFGGTQGVSITSGTGNDIITGSNFGDIISTGQGDDIINITTGTDVITGGGGADTFIVTAEDISTENVYSRITDFTAVADSSGADKISNIASIVTADISDVDVSKAESTGGQTMSITASVVSGVISLGDTADSSQIDTFKEWLALSLIICESGKTVGFEFDGNTYIVEETTGGDNIGSLLELTGVTSIGALSTSAANDSVIIS